MQIKYFDTELQTYGTIEMPSMATKNIINNTMKDNYKNLKDKE